MNRIFQLPCLPIVAACLLSACGQGPQEDDAGSTPTPALSIGMESANALLPTPVPEATPTPTPPISISMQEWIEDFESSAPKPAPMNRPWFFKRKRGGTGSGHFNLKLQAPLAGNESGRFLGGDLARMVLPPERPDTYRISIATHLEKLDMGRLILRAKFFGVGPRNSMGARDITLLKTVTLKDIDTVESHWTSHEFTRSFTLDGISHDASFMTVYAALDSQDDSTAAGGLVHFDNVGFSFGGEYFDPDIFRMDFDNEVPLPSYLEISKSFSLDREESVSGDASLMLDLPSSGKFNPSRYIGGDIVKVQVPSGTLGYRLSMKTWLQNVEDGYVIRYVSLRNREGRIYRKISMDEMTEPEQSWTEHVSEQLFDSRDADLSTLEVRVVFHRHTPRQVTGKLLIDDVDLRFHGGSIDPGHLRIDYDFEPLIPDYLKQPGVFLRIPDNISTGDHSLLLTSPLRDRTHIGPVGGDIARMDIPAGMHNLQMSLDTWVRELRAGQLTIRASLLNDDDHLDDVVLGKITKAEQQWTNHRFNWRLRGGSPGASRIRVRALLENESGEHAIGSTYIDNIKIVSSSEVVSPGEFRLDLDDESSLPGFLLQSGVFTRSKAEAASGDHSLMLNPQTPGEDPGPTGGDIVRMKIPADSNLITLSIRTWLKETGPGQLELRADFPGAGGTQHTGIPIAVITGPENGWTSHHFEHAIPKSADGATTLSIHAALATRPPGTGNGRVFIDDIELRFHGPNPKPISMDFNPAAQTYMQANFDTQHYMPGVLADSRVFSRSRDEASSGDHSLALHAPMADGDTLKIVGGDIARVELPGKGVHYSISIKTWLRQLNSGALVLHEQFLDKDGNVIMELPLGEVNKPEPGWTQHQFKGNTFRLGLVHSAAFMGLKVALDSQTVDPVEGIAYLDDIEILFH